MESDKINYTDLLEPSEDFFHCGEKAKLREKQRLEDDIFMSNALKMSSLSKCVSKQVCAMLVKNGRIVSTGINGTLPKATNCCDVFDKHDFCRTTHHEWSNKNETHAEMMAMLRCMEDLAGCTLYCTLEPCDVCTKYALAMGIRRIIYYNKYDLKNTDIESLMLEESGAEFLDYIALYGELK